MHETIEVDGEDRDLSEPLLHFPYRDVSDAVERLESGRWDSAFIRRHSLGFSRRRFRERVMAFWHSELHFSYDFAA